MKKNKGFTLIELLIVIVILGILISILAPRLINVRYKALYSACKSNIHSIATVLEIYSTNDSNKYYPLPDGNTLPLDLLTDYGITEKIVHCPTGPDVYDYEVDTVERTYIIECQGDHSAVNLPNPRYESGKGFTR